MDEPVCARCVGAGMRLRLFVTALGVWLASGASGGASRALAPESPAAEREAAQLEAARVEEETLPSESSDCDRASVSE